MAISYNPKIVTNGLVLCLDAANPKSYPGTGTTWSDLSGGNNGTLVNSPTFTSGTHGYFTFDGSSKRATILNPFGQSNFTTVSIWYSRVETVSSTSWRTLFATTATNIHHLISQQTSRVLGIFDGSFRSFGYTPPIDGKFHNYTVVYQSATNATLYVDGIFFSTIAIVLNLETSPIGSIGNWSSGNYWAGNIAQVSIYNRALSAQEVKQNFLATKGRYFGYQTVVYTASANMTLTNNGTQDVTMFKTSNNNSWNGEVRSTESFSAPCTIEFSKQAGTTDNGVSYLMIGWNEDPTTNTSYTSLDHASYPYRSDTYSVYNNGSQVHFSGAWDVNKRFYIVYDTDGFIRHYNGSTLLYSANYGTNKTVFVDSSFYSVNSTFGGLTNVKVARSSWNGFSYV